MTEQITLEEALELVVFHRNDEGTWCVDQVRGTVWGTVWGNVKGSVEGYVGCYVGGSVGGSVKGIVGGTIGGREWNFVETPKEKLGRLIKETGDVDLIEAFNQLENNQ